MRIEYSWVRWRKFIDLNLSLFDCRYSAVIMANNEDDQVDDDDDNGDPSALVYCPYNSCHTMARRLLKLHLCVCPESPEPVHLRSTSKSNSSLSVISASPTDESQTDLIHPPHQGVLSSTYKPPPILTASVSSAVSVPKTAIDVFVLKIIWINFHLFESPGKKHSVLII